MDATNPTFSTWSLLLPRAQGFLAGLLYLDSTATASAHFPNPHSLNPRIFNQWELLRTVRVKVEESRQRLVAGTHNLYLADLDDALHCFVKPTRFYETAISAYQNTLLHLLPTNLGEVLALCSLSHAVLHTSSASNQISFDFSHLKIWRNTIANHKHRQLFEDLIRVVYPEPHLTSQAFCSLSPLLDFSHALQPSYQEELNTIPIAQGDDMARGVLESFWDLDNSIDGVPVSSSFISQTGYCSYSPQLTDIQAPDLQDLQGSPIIHNLTRFLEDCGELTLVLSSPSSRGAADHPARSKIRNRIEPLYIQRLQNDDTCQDPIVQAIFSVIDSFTNLGYLQSANEARDYMLLLGKEILPSGNSFVEFCQSVCAAVDKAEKRTASSRSRRLRLSKPDRIPCDVCEEVFTRKNMKRHMERKHLGVDGESTPARLANADK